MTENGMPATHMTISSHCRALLKDCSGYAPEYEDGLADHLPMTLIALDYLGATASQMSDFKSFYEERLDLLPERRFGSHPSTIKNCIGRPEHFEICREFLEDETSREGQSTVLKRWLPVLVPGVCASAFHAPIRLAYGIEAKVTSEVTSGLAFWVTTSQPLGELGEQVDESLIDIAVRCARDTRDFKFRPGRIVDRMVELSRLGSENLRLSQPRSISLEDIVRFSLQAYSQDAHFTLLHTVTACHAFRLCLPYLNDAEMALRYLWQAVLLAFLTTKVRLNPGVNGARCSHTWPQLFERAVPSPDEHVIKLTYSAWREHEFRGSPGYVCVAGRICGYGENQRTEVA